MAEKIRNNEATNWDEMETPPLSNDFVEKHKNNLSEEMKEQVDEIRNNEATNWDEMEIPPLSNDFVERYTTPLDKNIIAETIKNIKSYEDIAIAQSQILSSRQKELEAIASAADLLRDSGYKEKAKDFFNKEFTEIEKQYTQLENEVYKVEKMIDEAFKGEIKDSMKEVKKCLKINNPVAARAAMEEIFKDNQQLKDRIAFKEYIPVDSVTTEMIVNKMIEEAQRRTLKFDKLMAGLNKSRQFVIEKAIKPLGRAFSDTARAIKEQTLAEVKLITAQAQKLAHTAKEEATEIINQTKSFYESIKDKIVGFAETVKDEALKIKESTINNIKQIKETAVQKINEKIDLIGKSITSFGQKLSQSYDKTPEMEIKINGNIVIDGKVSKNNDQYKITGTVILPAKVISPQDRSEILDKVVNKEELKR